MRTSNQFSHPNIIKRAAWFLAAFAFLFYGYQLIHYAQTQVSVLDEGLYLFKGWLFSTGAYQPFQEYGPWTNQMPFAFYLPGWFQQIFSPSLLTGRAMAIGLGLLTFIGLGLTLRKFAGDLVTACLLVLFVLNSAQIKMVSVATSQGLIAFLLTWMFYFLLGSQQRPWSLFAAGILAGLAVMVRINLLPILPIVLAFVLWEKGLKSALLVGLGISVFFIGGHAIFWPQILQIWAKWLPFSFLSDWAAPKTIPTWQPDTPFAFRVASFFLAFRFHLIALAGTLASFMLIDFQKLKDEKLWKTYWFLLISMLSLFLIHMWAALFNDYCVFCFPTYISFFEGIGYILIALALPRLDFKTGWRAGAGLPVLMVIFSGIAYSAEGLFTKTFEKNLYQAILEFQIPTTGAMLWQVFTNKFNLEFEALIKIANSFFPMVIALVIMAAVSGILALAFRVRKQKNLNTIGTMAIILMGVAALLTPSNLLSGGYNTYDCEYPVIERYDSIGRELSVRISEGASIYWAGYSPVTLLHLTEAEIYPAQLHSGYSYRISEENDVLLKYGWWNENLAKKWLSESDYLLLEAKNFEDLAALSGNLSGYELIYRSEPQNCRPNSEMLLYRRNQ